MEHHRADRRADCRRLNRRADRREDGAVADRADALLPGVAVPRHVPRLVKSRVDGQAAVAAVLADAAGEEAGTPGSVGVDRLRNDAGRQKR